MRVSLENCRLSFPSLFKPATFNGEDTGKYSATLLIPKEDKATLGKLTKAMKELIEEKKIPKLPADKKCVRDGDDFEQYGWDGYYAVKVSTTVRPHVVNRDMSPIVEGDGTIYSGCRVNANIELWYQNNNWGKRINGTLNGIQFVADDEPFGAARVGADDIFGRMDAEQEAASGNAADVADDDIPF